MRHYNVSIYLSSTRDPKDLESEINIMLDERITDFDTKIQISDIHVEEVIEDNP